MNILLLLFTLLYGSNVVIPVYVNPSDDIADAYSAGMMMREGERQKTLQNLFSKHLISKDTLSKQFLEDCKEEGIAIECVETIRKYNLTLSDKKIESKTNSKTESNLKELVIVASIIGILLLVYNNF